MNAAVRPRAAPPSSAQKRLERLRHELCHPHGEDHDQGPARIGPGSVASRPGPLSATAQGSGARISQPNDRQGNEAVGIGGCSRPSPKPTASVGEVIERDRTDTIASRVGRPEGSTDPSPLGSGRSPGRRARPGSAWPRRGASSSSSRVRSVAIRSVRCCRLAPWGLKVVVRTASRITAVACVGSRFSVRSSSRPSAEV